jgi:hypothetical protein
LPGPDPVEDDMRDGRHDVGGGLFKQILPVLPVVRRIGIRGDRLPVVPERPLLEPRKDLQAEFERRIEVVTTTLLLPVDFINGLIPAGSRRRIEHTDLRSG